MSEIRVENIIGETGVDAVKFTKGVNVTGVVTATTFSGAHSGSGANLTSLPAAQLTGTLPAISGANLTGISAGITMLDQWNIRTDNNKTNNQIIDTNWERSDWSQFAQIGTGMTQNPVGIFSFPQTGIYLIMAQFTMNASAPSYAGIEIDVSTNSGTDYSAISYGYLNPNGYENISIHGIFDVQNISTHRVRFIAKNDNNVQYSGDTNSFRSGVTFIRLGDT